MKTTKKTIAQLRRAARRAFETGRGPAALLLRAADELHELARSVEDLSLRLDSTCRCDMTCDECARCSGADCACDFTPRSTGPVPEGDL